MISDEVPWPARTSSSRQTAATTKAPTAVKLTAAVKAAKRYRERDVHEAFFRPRLRCPGRANKRKSPSRKQARPLTAKERSAAALAHWQLHHGSDSNPTQHTDNITAQIALNFNWSPEIMGHHQQDYHHDSIRFTPVPVTELCDYIANRSMDRQLIRQLSFTSPIQTPNPSKP